MKYLPILFFAVILTVTACANALPAEIQAEQINKTEAQPQPSATLENKAEINRTVENGQPLVARVNNQPIFLDSFNKQVVQLEQNNDKHKSRTEIRQQILTVLIDQLIIEQVANRLGITVPEVVLEAKIKKSTAQQGQTDFKKWLTDNGLVYDEFRDILRSQLITNRIFEYITNNIPEIMEQIHLSQILITKKTVAKTVIDQLKGGADFAVLAREHSIDKDSKINGGSLGWFPRGTGIVPEDVEKIAFSLHTGEISGPISASSGLYIIKLEGKETERPLTTAMVQKIKKRFFTNWLIEQRSAAIIENYIVM